MKLRNRLARLEAQRQGHPESPRVIVFTSCCADPDGNLQTLSEFAFVQSASGWQTVARDESETDAGFRQRAEAMVA